MLRTILDFLIFRMIRKINSEGKDPVELWEVENVIKVPIKLELKNDHPMKRKLPAWTVAATVFSYVGRKAEVC